MKRMTYTLIANSGIQLFTFRVQFNAEDRFREWFHEWYDTSLSQWKLELIYELRTEDATYYFRKAELLTKGYLANPEGELDVDELRHDGVQPLKIDEEMCDGVKGEIFSMSFGDRHNLIKKFENQWLPIPYFFKRTERRFKFGPLNWSRFKLIPVSEDKGKFVYDIILAFDTRTSYEDEGINENPTFPDRFKTSIDFSVCKDELMLLDYCAANEQWSYIDAYLMKLAHPEITRIGQLRGPNIKKMAYISTYIFLINYIAKKDLFPTIKLYKDKEVETRNVDMVIDIGNSRTTALLVEDNRTFNQVRPLELIDYTDLLRKKDGKEEGYEINKHNDPFDMRLAFRKVNFGDFGLTDSVQFVNPSLVRLGEEANHLIHKTTSLDSEINKLSTYSSPKRYLWDWRPSQEEWQFLVLPGEKDNHVLYINGITNFLKSDGQFDSSAHQGTSFRYSRRSLMTFAFLEMLTQARVQLNSAKHRSTKDGLGHQEKPRKIKRIIITCPTAMSKIEREGLIRSAQDAVKLIDRFYNESNNRHLSIEIVPSLKKNSEDSNEWYYDEATCAQLVYMYGEVGYKYKGNCEEFFNLYGRKRRGESQPSLIVGSLDIGAGTTDLMISKYTYTKGDMTVIKPTPLFYDSFYFAGDDMLHSMILNLMLLSQTSAFRTQLSELSYEQYHQRIKNFFGPDHNGQTIADRILRKDFTIQYSIPLMHYFLNLVSIGADDCVVKYRDVFSDSQPNEAVIMGFLEKTGIDIRKLDWKFKKEEVCTVIEKEFDPLLKKIATIMYSQACDIILLSGRPASLPPIRDIFLKYYPTSPERIITLNNYYVGDWFPFGDNTGYITNPKTIVAMGGIIAHYATELSNLNKFVIDLTNLKSGLKSTINFIETPNISGTQEGENNDYFLTPDKQRGDIKVSYLPTALKSRQIGIDSYYPRSIYSFDFNKHSITKREMRKAERSNESLTDTAIQARVNEYIDGLRRRMPFTLTIERDPEDYEKLTISNIVDRDNNNIDNNDLEIHIQSLGVEDRYWLDSGEFNF